jgi:transposase
MKLRVQKFKKMQNGKTYFYPWIGYSYRNEKGTPTFKRMISLANLPDQEVEAIKTVLNIEGKVTDNILKVSFFDALPIGAEFAALRLAEELGIAKALECLPKKDAKLIFAMVLNRVIEPFPMSKKALFENLPGSGLERILALETDNIKLDDMYFALDKLQPCKNNIEKFLFDYRKINNSRMFLYDITSSYFEGNSCPLEAFGYNRDGKKGKKQIVIGLLTDDSGCPISVEVFAGNTADQTTVIDRIDSMRERFGIDEMVFIGDRGMLTKARRNDLQSGDYEKVKYISALSRGEFTKFLDDDNHPLQLSLFDRQNLVEVEKDGIRYVLSFNPELENESRETRERLIEKTAEKLAGIKKSVSSGRLKDRDKIAQRLYRWHDKWGSGRFFKVDYDEGKFEYKLDEEKVNDYAKIDGFYVLTSDVIDLSTEEVRIKYKSLQMVEQAFRTMKTTDLFLRPIRHWNAERVRAHVFVCMLSYMIIWRARQVFAEFLEPEEELRISLRTIWKKLEKVQIGRVKIGNKVHEQLGVISGEIKKILKKAGASLVGKNLKKVGL